MRYGGLQRVYQQAARRRCEQARIDAEQRAAAETPTFRFLLYRPGAAQGEMFEYATSLEAATEIAVKRFGPGSFAKRAYDPAPMTTQQQIDALEAELARATRNPIDPARLYASQWYQDRVRQLAALKDRQAWERAHPERMAAVGR